MRTALASESNEGQYSRHHTFQNHITELSAMAGRRSMPGSCILGIESTGDDLQKRVLFWLRGPRKAKRCDVYYVVTLRSVLVFIGTSLREN